MRNSDDQWQDMIYKTIKAALLGGRSWTVVALSVHADCSESRVRQIMGQLKKEGMVIEASGKFAGQCMYHAVSFPEQATPPGPSPRVRENIKKCFEAYVEDGMEPDEAEYRSAAAFLNKVDSERFRREMKLSGEWQRRKINELAQQRNS